MTSGHGRDYTLRFLEESQRILGALSAEEIEEVVDVLARTRDQGGRVFFAGSGGGAAHASHATGDLRKMADIEAYCVSDNVAELTARVNDDGWDTAYGDWLRVSRIGPSDTLFVFSVGGGDVEHRLSLNLVGAMEVARDAGAAIVGVVGRDGGMLKQRAKASVHVSTDERDQVTAQTEGIQALVWHLVVTHPAVAVRPPKWEEASS